MAVAATASPLPTDRRPTWAEICRLLRDDVAIERIGAREMEILRALEVVGSTPEGAPYLLPELLNGLVLRHRLTEAEVAGDHLELDPDLTLLAVPALLGLFTTTGEPLRLGTHLELARPTAVRPVGDGRRQLHGRRGWLAGFRGADVVEVTLIDSVLVLGIGGEAADPTVLAEILGRRVEDLLDRVTSVGVPPAFPLIGLLTDALTADPALLDGPIPPLTEVLAHAGVPHRQAFLGRPGQADVPVPPHAHGHSGSCGLPVGTPEPQLRAALAIGEVIGRFAVGVDDPCDGRPLGTALSALRDWDLLQRMAHGASDGPGVPRMVEAALGSVPRRLRAPLHYLRAVHRLSRGAVGHALGDLETALRTDPDAEPVLELLAELRWVLGDIDGAAALFDRLRVPDALPSADGGALDRARTLHERIRSYLVISGCHDLFDHQARALEGQGLDPAGVPHHLLLDDILFERAGLARVDLELTPLLDAPEAELLRAWAGVPRRWWRIAGACDRLVQLRGVAHDQAVRAALPAVGEEEVDGLLRHGDLILARLLPTGDGWWTPPGALYVDADSEADGLPDADDLPGAIRWLRSAG